jgi:hypothetical protein
MSADVELDVDAHAVRLALKRLDPEAEKRIRDVVKKDTIRVRSEIRDYAPQQTGLLASSIRSRTQFTQKYSRGTVTVVGPARKYAWIVEHGSKGANQFEGKKYISRAEKVVLTRFDERIRKAVGDAIEAAGLND